MSRPTAKDLTRRLSSLWPRAARVVLAGCAAGEVSPPIAVARLLLACEGLDGVEAAVDAALARLGPAEAPALVEVQRLLGEHRDGVAAASALLLAHPDPEARSDSAAEGIARFRDFFDQAVSRHEVVSVATVGSGRDLAGYPDTVYDLVLAVDSFPYLHAGGPGLVETHVREAARVLRPGGALAIMNFSYKDDLAADRAELERLCGLVGFDLEVAGQQPFELWDGDAFPLPPAAVRAGR